MAATKSGRKTTPAASKTKKGGSGSRCWTGYEPVPGKKPYSRGSCRKK